MATRAQMPRAPQKKKSSQKLRNSTRSANVSAATSTPVSAETAGSAPAKEHEGAAVLRPRVGKNTGASNHTSRVMQLEHLGKLIEILAADGYEVIGPTVRDGAVTYERISGVSDLPAGWTDEQEPGHYRLNKTDSPAVFVYSLGALSWKRYLHPADVRLWAAERQNGSFHILNNDPSPTTPRAFLGVRACELAAISAQDRVLLKDKYRDPIYASRRENAFIVAVQCTHSASTCFCASIGAGPKVPSGFDLLLTELPDPENHRFVVESGSDHGAEILAQLGGKPAPAADLEAAEQAVASAAQQQRKLETAGLKEFLYENFEHPRWEKIAARCLSCANCTMSCPTCFCTTVEDATEITGSHAERWRRWDSCFTQSFSYIHGGSIRTSVRARYRQWMTHKLAAWVDQFGSLGCVGCGRCITWCPAGIDITEEVRAMREGGSRADS